MRTWIFQGNPKDFNIDKYVSEYKHLKWKVTNEKHQNEISIGDIVYIWRANGRNRDTGGIIAKAIVTSEPTEQNDQDLADLWYDEAAREYTGVALEVLEAKPYEAYISRNFLLTHPVLKDLLILQSPRQTNYPLSDLEAAEIEKLWNGNKLIHDTLGKDSTFAIANTDVDWFQFLKEKCFTDMVNFWTPTPWNITGLQEGDLIYFMLKSPIRKLGGYGRFVKYENMTRDDAWNEFGFRNGCRTKRDFIDRMTGYRESNRVRDLNGDIIGCIVLSYCVFWDEKDYKNVEDYGLEFSKNIVKLKYYKDGNRLLNEVEPVGTRPSYQIVNETVVQKRASSRSVRYGQSKFKSLITDTYNGHCCISGESCPELLEAAHIQPYIDERSNHPQNGLLLRVDLHTLFDNGLLSIDDDYRVRISGQVESEYYCGFDKVKIQLPLDPNKYPSKDALVLKLKEFRD